MHRPQQAVAPPVHTNDDFIFEDFARLRLRGQETAIVDPLHGNVEPQTSNLQQPD